MNKNSKRLKFIPTRKQFASASKWLIKEIISGLAVAAAVAIATLWINNYQVQQGEKEQLKKLHLGLSQQFIDSVLGIPMVQFFDSTSNTDISIYKQKNCVVWCAYSENEIVAYVIMAKTNKHLYKVNANIIMPKDAYLTNFTYEEFSLEGENQAINVPANNNDYAYYSELYYGAGPADYNYFILGSYKNYFDEDDFLELLSAGWATDPQKEIDRLRSQVKPNAYGMIQSGYEDVFSLIPMDEKLRTYNEALFGDWDE